MEKQRIKEEMEAKMMEQRAKYVAKAKKIALEPEMEERPKKSGGGKVRGISQEIWGREGKRNILRNLGEGK